MNYELLTLDTLHFFVLAASNKIVSFRFQISSGINLKSSTSCAAPCPSPFLQFFPSAKTSSQLTRSVIRPKRPTGQTGPTHPLFKPFLTHAVCAFVYSPALWAGLPARGLLLSFPAPPGVYSPLHCKGFLLFPSNIYPPLCLAGLPAVSRWVIPAEAVIHLLFTHHAQRV
jgi:hypothetical protein